MAAKVEQELPLIRKKLEAALRPGWRTDIVVAELTKLEVAYLISAIDMILE